MYEKVKDLLASKFEVDPTIFSEDATLEELGLTSLDMVEFAEIASTEWNTPINDDELYEAGTVAQVLELLMRRQAGAVSQPQR